MSQPTSSMNAVLWLPSCNELTWRTLQASMAYACFSARHLFLARLDALTGGDEPAY